jgi:hypothetical protein
VWRYSPPGDDLPTRNPVGRGGNSGMGATSARLRQFLLGAEGNRWRREVQEGMNGPESSRSEQGRNDAPQPTFAHESEAEFARILDFYGVQWEYETRSFVLERDEDGNATESFTPDFRLPEFDLYIELTTLKPSLAHRKNHKLNRLRELYPDVNVKLFRLQDVHSLMVRFGRAKEEPET